MNLSYFPQVCSRSCCLCYIVTIDHFFGGRNFNVYRYFQVVELHRVLYFMKTTDNNNGMSVTECIVSLWSVGSVLDVGVLKCIVALSCLSVILSVRPTILSQNSNNVC